MRERARQIGWLLLLALLPAVASALFHPRRPSWQADEVVLSLAESWGDKVLWVDARPAEDYEHEHIPGAVSLNEDAWDALLPDALDAWTMERIIVVYCSSLSCQASHEVAQRLREELGSRQVRVLKGGWEAWKRAHSSE
jgi:rhodanese-related sulfurtransferase